MKLRTSIKAGGRRMNHNETMVRSSATPRGPKVKTNINAGGTSVRR